MMDRRMEGKMRGRKDGRKQIWKEGMMNEGKQRCWKEEEGTTHSTWRITFAVFSISAANSCFSSFVVGLTHLK